MDKRKNERKWNLMKKLLASLLMVCMMLGVVACGSNANNAPADGGNDVVVDNQVETEPADVPETEPVAEPETEPVAEPETETVEEVAYTYTDLSQTMYAKRDVNVRDLPSVDGNKVDGLSFAEEVSVTGKCNETGWYRISYGGRTAYVSNNYLVSEKPVPQEPVAAAPVEETPAEPEVVLEKSPWVLYGEPDFNENDGCVYYFILENDWPQVYDGINMAHFDIACQYYTECTGRTGEYAFILHSMGRYAEGKVGMIQLFIP